MNFAKKMKNKTKRLVSYVLAIILVLVGALSYANPAHAVDPTAIAAAIGTGVKTLKEVLDVYDKINPPQEGYTTVINSSPEMVTVRSYNNNDWAMFVAAGQLNLKPGAQGKMTSKSDPFKLVWKRGNYGTLDAFGTKNLSQSLAPKDKQDKQYVFVIGQDNTL